ncbi:hypothetical protein SAICODRAFT_69153 [Saitoella complicata NRRL Y-17804]|uniref:uncharacterized protein n=1 Tax=Saitoella complicata (strain BCRC 22490 / CBS 7301 / JCM 7358 / NBRC 10748 / NRRL Y-17804) TaxID=698492 RepID=UPI000867BC4A|nr:uncharacterized protein SAICODRAFT_69153 [Saitoella complicata NRRL Y-17804]ODQ55845.1 hypothetical protein SAICODRAFT_69153 [Saitoella complicata NRRL Y-17804]
MSSKYKLNVRDPLHFPGFEDLPFDIYSRRYFGLTQEGNDIVYCTKVHWCFMGKSRNILHPFRPGFVVTDRYGKETDIWFYFDKPQEEYPVLKKFMVGHTVLVMYATGHRFRDKSVGLRLEDDKLEYITVLPCSLPGIVNFNDNLRKDTAAEGCRVCGKTEPNVPIKRCGRCGVKYCSQTCQVMNWNMKHKKECPVFAQLRKWNEIKWQKFDTHRKFE